MKKIRVMIVDDHSVVRVGLSAIINLERDMAVCGEAESGTDAVELAGRLAPDVVVMDLVMPDMDGADATAALMQAAPGSKVLILTTFGTSAEIRRAMDAGAVGAVTKDISNSSLADAIRDTANGIPHFSPEIRQTMDELADAPVLSGRQMELLASIARGLSNDDLVVQLGISKTRVKQLLAEVYARLGAANRAEAVAIALKRRIISAP